MERPFTFNSFERRSILRGLLAGGVSILGGCNWDGNFSLFGYSTRTRYNNCYKTIYVPIFGNRAMQTTPYRGLEMELTRAVIKEIETVTPMKVVSDPNRADTELLGTVVNLTKNILNRDQQNEVREGNVIVGVELVWRDLKTQQILSNPPRPTGVLPTAELAPFDPDNPPRPDAPPIPVPVRITLTGMYLPEVGQSNASAQTQACKRVAQQIVNMMEVGWQLPPKPTP